MAVTNDTNKCMKINNNRIGIGKEDGISSLPDDILIYILSLLSLNYAIAASTLSRRWLNLWTHVPSIHLDIHTSKGPFIFWTSFSQQILPKLTSPYINRFSLNLICNNTSDQHRSVLMNSWFTRIPYSWNVREIIVTCDGYKGQIFFPALFKIESLVTLKLGAGFTWNLPGSKPLKPRIKLPKLKKLCVQITVSQCRFVENLINSCPLLEDVTLDIKRGDHGVHTFIDNVTISSLSLKRLSLRLLFTISFRPRNKFIIDAPSLEFFKLHSHSPTLQFESFPLNLTEVEIDGGLSIHSHEAISKVKCLRLRCPQVIKGTTIVFDQLSRLSCGMPSREDNLKELLSLLDRCPVLEFVTLNFVLFDKIRWRKNNMWLLCDIMPTCLSNTLKKIEISCKSAVFLNDEINLVKYFINNARVLEKFIINVAGDGSSECVTEYEKCQEVEVCKKIFGWARCSPSRCQIAYFGSYLKIELCGKGGELIKGPKGYVISI